MVVGQRGKFLKIDVFSYYSYNFTMKIVSRYCGVGIKCLIQISLCVVYHRTCVHAFRVAYVIVKKLGRDLVCFQMSLR